MPSTPSPPRSSGLAGRSPPPPLSLNTDEIRGSTTVSPKAALRHRLLNPATPSFQPLSFQPPFQQPSVSLQRPHTAGIFSHVSTTKMVSPIKTKMKPPSSAAQAGIVPRPATSSAQDYAKAKDLFMNTLSIKSEVRVNVSPHLTSAAPAPASILQIN